MLSHTFWKNAALLRQIPWKSTLRVEVCHIKQFCTRNNDTSREDFGSLAVSSGKQENLEWSSESELAYFANEETRPPQESPQVTYKTPLKQTLAYTNKVLFGPLLETAAERRRRHKIKDETEIRQKNKKKKKPKKSQPALGKQPLILKPENAHLLEIFAGVDSKCVDKFHHHKLKIEHQQVIVSFSD